MANKFTGRDIVPSTNRIKFPGAFPCIFRELFARFGIVRHCSFETSRHRRPEENRIEKLRCNKCSANWEQAGSRVHTRSGCRQGRGSGLVFLLLSRLRCRAGRRIRCVSWPYFSGLAFVQGRKGRCDISWSNACSPPDCGISGMHDLARRRICISNFLG